MITFYKWIKKQTLREDTIGDLARDVSEKERGLLNTRFAWRMYLIRQNACVEALEALKEAWEEYAKK